MLADNNINGIFMNVNGGGFLSFNNGAGIGIQDNSALDWTGTCWGSLSNVSSGAARRLSSIGPGVGTGGVNVADTNGYAVNPSTIFLGSWNGGFTFGGFIAQLAVIKNNQLANKIIPPAAFTGTNGWWWNADATNSKIGFGNVLQIERTQPWTVVAAICCMFAQGGGHNGVTGIVFTNVLAASPFTGYELWVDGNAKLTVRIINDAATNLIDVNGGTNLADGRWHVVAATYDGFDGVAEAKTVVSDTLTASIVSSAGQTYQIGNQQGLSFGSIGAIGLFRQYNVVKPLSFIQQFKINFTLPTSSNDATCVLAPSLSEGSSSTTTADLSASGFTGTMSSSAVWLRG